MVFEDILFFRPHVLRSPAVLPFPVKLASGKKKKIGLVSQNETNLPTIYNIQIIN